MTALNDAELLKRDGRFLYTLQEVKYSCTCRQLYCA